MLAHENDQQYHTTCTWPVYWEVLGSQERPSDTGCPIVEGLSEISLHSLQYHFSVMTVHADEDI